MSWHRGDRWAKLPTGDATPSHVCGQDDMDQPHPSSPSRRSPARTGALLAVLALVATSCASGRLDATKPVGENAKDIDFLMRLSGFMAVAVGIVVTAMVVLIIFKFRSRPDNYDDLPEQVHGNTKVEVGATALAAGMLVVLAGFTVPLVLELNEEGGDITIGVEGQQWWWQFTYDFDGDGTAEITTANEIVFPIDEEVNLQITSNDVIHSFWVPELNGKRDAVPGRVHPWLISSPEVGVFWGECTEFCGLSHANMQIRAVALERADYDAWVERQMQPAEIPAAEGSPEQLGFELFATNCTSCHVVDTPDERFQAAADGRANQVAGLAPNLTHLMSRTSFAGALFDLYLDDGDVNLADLREWVRNAPSMKPMAADEQRGMPSFEETLDEEDLDNIVAYLRTLGDEPALR